MAPKRTDRQPRSPDEQNSETCSDEPQSFEDALTQLERVVRELEEGSLDLDASLKGYERGANLLRHCHVLLERAERRVELLIRSRDQEDGSEAPEVEDFDEQEMSLGEKAARRDRRRSRSPNRGSQLPAEGDAEGDTDVDDPRRLF